MIVASKNIPKILPDSEILYLELIQGVIESMDDLCHLEITKAIDSYHFRVAPSEPRYNPVILKEILRFHNLIGIHIDLSKSIKTSGSIDFFVKPCI